jgi:hypothetical protein
MHGHDVGGREARQLRTSQTIALAMRVRPSSAERPRVLIFDEIAALTVRPDQSNAISKGLSE